VDHTPYTIGEASLAHVRKLLLAFGCLALLIGVGKPAVAATIDYKLTFSASDFAPLFGADPVPVGFVSGQFTFSLDPTQSSSGNAAANFINLPHGTLGYILTGSGVLIVGGTVNGVGGSSSGYDDFSLSVLNFSTTPTFGGFIYGLAADTNNLFSSNNGSVHVDAAATPIPGALPLFVSAIGGLGLLGWRRRNAGA